MSGRTDWAELVRSNPPLVWSKIDHNSSQIEQTRLEPKCLPCQSVIRESAHKTVLIGKNRSKWMIGAFGANLERLLQYLNCVASANIAVELLARLGKP